MTTATRRQRSDRVRWTPELDEQLRAVYTARGLPAAEAAMGLRRSQVKNRVHQLGLVVTDDRSWTAAEDQFLRDHYGVDMTAAMIAGRLGRGIPTTRRRARLIGARSSRLWTREEETAVRDRYATDGAKALALELLGAADEFAVMAVYRLASRLGVATLARHPPEVLAEVSRLNAAGLTDSAIAQRMTGRFPGFNGRNERERVTAIRARLGLKVNQVMDPGEGVRKQLKTLGLKRPTDLRAAAHKRLARSYGLPEDLRPRQVQVLLALTGGPKTKTELETLLGIRGWLLNRPKPGSHYPDAGKHTTYLRDLEDRGLVLYANRRSSGPGAKRLPGLYTLTAAAIDLLAKGGQPA